MPDVNHASILSATASPGNLPRLPYSPDLNPIEMVFAKTKALLRKAAIRTVDALWRAIGRIAQSLTREECANYFQHCGYVQSG